MITKNILLKILSFLPAILIMIMIFSFSAEDSLESTSTSRKFTKSVVTLVDNGFNLELSHTQTELLIDKYEHLTRKLAHFTEYMLLGISLFIPLCVFYVRGYTVYIITIIFCCLYAITDEIHQLFIAGRSASPYDVIIDSSGSILGIIIIGLILRKLFKVGLHNS